VTRLHLSELYRSTLVFEVQGVLLARRSIGLEMTASLAPSLVECKLPRGAGAGQPELTATRNLLESSVAKGGVR
jgi:hypothetical protein